MEKHKPILSHRGVDIYASFKDQRPLAYWYALVPNHQAEGGGHDFDVRELPEAYRAGLLIVDRHKDTTSTESFVKSIRAEHEAHKEAIRRAIDDGYDLTAGTQKGQKSRLQRWISALCGT